MYFSAWDPDKYFGFVLPYLRWIWTREFFLVSLALVLIAVGYFISDYQRMVEDTAQFFSFREKTLAEFIDFWFLIFLTGFIHECAHGLTGKFYGAEVHQMGFLFMYFLPAFYTDVTDMYLFDKDYKRFWSIFAGIWVEVMMCAVSLIIWTLTSPGSFVNEWAYKFFLITSISAMFVNLNPLMKYDGYYALTQYLKVDNLREDSFDYLKQWVKHYLSGGGVAVERASRRKHRLYLIYGPLAMAYTAAVLFFILLFVKNVSVSKMGDWGWGVAAVVAWLVLGKYLKAIAAYLLQTYGNAKEAIVRWRQSWQTKAVTAAVLLLVLFPPFSIKVTTDFVLEPAARLELRAPVSGLVEQVRVREGDRVEPGTVLAVLRNSEIEARAEVLQRELQLAEQYLRAARASGDLAASQDYDRQRQRLELEWKEARRKRAELELRTPIGGVVTTPQVEQRVGEYLREGELFAVVADRHLMRARVLVQDIALEDIREGAWSKLNLRARPLETFTGQVEQILPAAALDRPVSRPAPLVRHGQELYNYFAVTLEIPNPEGKLWEGMTGTAKIYGPRYPLAWRGVRGAWRWARSQVWF